MSQLIREHLSTLVTTHQGTLCPHLSQHIREHFVHTCHNTSGNTLSTLVTTHQGTLCPHLSQHIREHLSTLVTTHQGTLVHTCHNTSGNTLSTLVTTHQGTLCPHLSQHIREHFVHTCCNSASHFGLIVGLSEWTWYMQADLHLKKGNMHRCVVLACEKKTTTTTTTCYIQNSVVLTFH